MTFLGDVPAFFFFFTMFDPLLSPYALVSVSVTSMGKVQAHDSVMDVAEGGEDLEIRRGSAEGLDVDAPVLEWDALGACRSYR